MKKVFILEEITGQYEDTVSMPIGAYVSQKAAIDKANHLNGYWNEIEKAVEDVCEKYINLDNECDLIFLHHLSKTDKVLADKIAEVMANEDEIGVDLYDDDYEIMDRFYAMCRSYMAEHERDEFIKCAVECGYTEEMSELIEKATPAYNIGSWGIPYYRVCRTPVTLYEE